MWLSEFTHTVPGPPPGAGVPAGSLAFDVFALAELELALDGALAATGDAAGAGVSVLWNQERLAGEAVAAGDAAAAGDALGAEAVAAVVSFLARLCLAGLGEASGVALADAAAGDSVVAAVVASFLVCLCFLAGLAEASGLALGDGVWATRVARENPNNVIMRVRVLFMIAETTDAAVAVAILK